MPLTEEQKQFIRNHVANLGKKEAKRKTAAYTDYLRRAAKVKKSMDQLSGSDKYEDIMFVYADAEDKAKRGLFEDAYKQLEQTKNIAKVAAKGYVDSLTYNNLQERIFSLKYTFEDTMRDADAVVGEVRVARRRIGSDPALVSPKAALEEDPSRENGKKLLDAFLAAKADIAIVFEAAPDAAQAAAATLAGADIAGELERMRRQIDVVRKFGSKKQAKSMDSLEVQVDDLKDIASIDGRLATPDYLISWIGDAVAQGKIDLAQKVSDWYLDFAPTDLGLTPREYALEDANKPPGTGQVTDVTDGVSKTSYEDAEKRYNKSIELARARYLEDKKKDSELQTKDAVIPQPRQLPTYKVLDGLGEERAERLRLLAPPLEGGEEDKSEPLSEQEIEDTALAMAEHVSKSLSELDPNSDVVFDLLMKDKKMFVAQIGRELGWDRDPKKWTLEQSQAADRIGDAMAKRVATDCPNKLSDDRKTITFGDVVYKDPQKLGEGGMCIAYRYTSEDGKTIVMKTPKPSRLPGQAEKQRDMMVTEMRSHRLAMGGEGGEGHENLVGMMGGVTDSNGGLHMLVEDCPGGDVDGFATAMNQALSSGSLPPQVRSTLVRQLFKEAAEGLKYLKQQGLTHNDLKGANFFIDENGTIKIADLGSSRVVNEEGETQKNEGEVEIPQTGFFRAPEWAESGKSDVFILGGVLSVLQSPDYTAGNPTPFWARKDRVVPHQATSFDRLRNAMLDEDPAKRPTIESVLMSSYLGDFAVEDVPESDDTEDGEEAEEIPDPMAELKLAIVAFGRCKAVRELAKAENVMRNEQADLERYLKERRDLDQRIEESGEKPGETDRWKVPLEVSDLRISGSRRTITECEEAIARLSEDPERLELLKVIENAGKRGRRKPVDVLGSQPPRRDRVN